MTARNDDRLLSAWLHDVAPSREPEHLLGQVLARTARTRRRPAWRSPERFDLMSAFTSRLAPASPVPWRLVAVAAALLLALVAALAFIASGRFKTPAPPYGLAGNGSIVYGSKGDIFAADPTGSGARTLLAGDPEDRAPILSLDGTKLSFLRGPDSASELWVANADGSSPRRVAGPFKDFNGGIDWSPQGDLLAVTTGDDGLITLVRADGSGFSAIDTGLAGVGDATFRPLNGAQLSFRATSTAGDLGFYLVNRDGSGQVHLALDPGFQDDPYYDENRTYYFNDLAWDGTGTHVVFHTLEPDPVSIAGPGFRIHTADIDEAGAVSNERILEFGSSDDDEYSAMFIPGTIDIIYRRLEGSTHTLMRGSTAVGAGSTDLGISAQDWITAALAPDGTSLLVVAPGGPSGPSQRVELLNLATLQVTQLSVSEDFSWQRVPASGS